MSSCVEAGGPLALSMGDPAGIGGEITLQAWARRAGGGVPAFFAVDDPERLSGLARALGIGGSIRAIGEPEEAAAIFPEALPVLPLGRKVAARPGYSDCAGAGAALASLDRCIELAQSGRAGGLVTNPIDKRMARAAGMAEAGQTEYIAARCGAAQAGLMLLAAPALKTALVTTHLPLLEVPAALTREKILEAGLRLARGLEEDFGLSAPRIAVCGLNPHAGEGGILGREELEVIAPAVGDLAERGVLVSGPHPADSLFHEAARKTYDAALCMYHDQALIALKTLDFAHGVNVTLGLPIVRASPDHGTGSDIAGRGVADPSSLLAALRLAGEIARTRARARAR